MADDIPQPGELLGDLRKVVRSGLAVSRLTDLPVLAGLAIVATEAKGNRSLDVAIAIEKAIREGVAELGDGPTGECVRLLLGMTPRSRGLLVKERRDLAAEHLGIEAETFRKGWESRLLAELADELYKLEAERRIPIRVKPRRRRGPVLDELREGAGDKSLGRREAEARMWSLAYALRADLLGVARLHEEGDQLDVLPVIHAALWRFAAFMTAMTSFVDDYGSAFVMAGNEVTVMEAASLLRVRPPLTDEQVSWLRVISQRPEAATVEGLIEQLGGQPAGQVVLEVWEEWLGG